MVRHGSRIILLLTVALLCCPAWSSAEVKLTSPDRAHVGEVFLVTVVSDKPIESIRLNWGGRELAQSYSGVPKPLAAMFLLGTDVKSVEPGLRELGLELSAGGNRISLKNSISLYLKDYPEQRLTVPQKMVSPPKETMERIRSEAVLVRKALKTVSGERLWSFPFFRPVPGQVVSIYGLKRFFNNQPRAPHRGIDFRAGQGDPIMAAADGRVILAGDHYFAGKSVYLDHGLGVVTAYFHMSEIGVAEGGLVSRGEPIGKIGATGRVTGPHLHFGLYILGQAVDPMPLFEDDFARQAREAMAWQDLYWKLSLKSTP